MEGCVLGSLIELFCWLASFGLVAATIADAFR